MTYILGAGSVGCLLASGLKNVKFIVRSAQKKQWLKDNNYTVQIRQLFNKNKIVKFQIQGACAANEIPESHIDTLVVSVKTFDTVKALEPLLGKLDKHSQILLVQNGMGVAEELCKVWPDPATRPEFFQGVISHGIFQNKEENGTYNFEHAGYADLKIGRLPRDFPNGKVESDGDASSVPQFITELLHSSLNASFQSYQHLLVYQIEKLTVNMCMNALTTILDCVNHELETPYTSELFHEVIAEAIEAVNKTYPSLKDCSIYSALDVDRLTSYAAQCGIQINGQNSSSMRQDLVNLRDVEIDYINGYIVGLAKRAGIPAKVNTTVVLLVKMKLAIYRNRAGVVV